MAYEDHTDRFSFDPGAFLGARVGVVHAAWHREVVTPMVTAAVGFLEAHVQPQDIVVKEVPGSFELALGAQFLMDKERIDGVVCLGCIVRGETHHFHYLCQDVIRSLSALSCHRGVPIGFGVLTVDNMAQALQRAGGTHGNKGKEAAFSVLHMLHTFVRVSAVDEEEPSEKEGRQ